MSTARVVGLSILFLIPGCCELFAQADEFAQWKPHTGDRFIYLQTVTSTDYWHGAASHTTTTVDTLEVAIVSADTTLVGIADHAVLTRDTIVQGGVPRSTYDAYYVFRVGSYPGSSHPFAIQEFSYSDTLTYDFSLAVDSQLRLPHDTLDVYKYRFGTSSGEGEVTYDFRSALYAPSLHWLCGWSYSGASIPPNQTYTDYESTSSLIFASSDVDEVVAPRHTPEPRVTFDPQNSTLYLTVDDAATPTAIRLVDVLGRPVRSWITRSEFGSQQRSFSVLGLGRGVYFVCTEYVGRTKTSRVVIP